MGKWPATDLDTDDPRNVPHAPGSTEEHAIICVPSRGSSTSLTWSTNLTVEVGLDSEMFQRRPGSSVPGCDAPRSPMAAGILRTQSCPDGGGNDTHKDLDALLQGPAAVRVRDARLARMLDRQIRETEMAGPLAIEVHSTLTNASDATVVSPLETILVSPLLDLVGTSQIYNDDLRYIGE